MAENSKIEWTNDTWNPITGCSVVSRGCTNCYAMRLAGTRLQHHPSRVGLTRDTKAGPVWNGETRLNAEWLDQPLHRRAPRNIFVCAHGDLFHESVPDAWIDRVFAVMALASWHTFQVLTKRPARMRQYLSMARAHPVGMAALDQTLECHRDNPHSDVGAGVMLQGDIAHLKAWPLPNVWLGVSAEDQASADERLPDLLAAPAAVRFVSCEPLLGPVDLLNVPYPSPPEDAGRRGSALHEHEVAGMTGNCVDWVPRLDWVIIGGESGPNARPYGYEWARDLIQQCASAGVACFHKQVGAHPVGFDGHRVHLRDRKGGDPALWPEELRVREMPAVRR